jgi:hypothetical protein
MAVFMAQQFDPAPFELKRVAAIRETFGEAVADAMAFTKFTGKPSEVVKLEIVWVSKTLADINKEGEKK